MAAESGGKSGGGGQILGDWSGWAQALASGLLRGAAGGMIGTMGTTAETLADAVAHHQAGRWHDAEQIYSRLVTAEPNNAVAWYLSGKLSHQLGQAAAAVQRLQRAVQLAPAFTEAHSDLGNLLAELGRREEALVCSQRVVELWPNSAESIYNLANGLAAVGRTSEAIESYRRAIELKPDFPQALLNLGIAFDEQGKWDEAISCHRRALALNPGDANALSNLGNALRHRGALEEAVSCYQRALALAPDFADAQYNLGLVLHELGRLDEAAACYRRTLALAPRHAGALNNLGNVLRDRSELEEAALCYRQALEVAPHVPETYNNLGNALDDLERVDEAIACYRRALELRPDYADAHSNLGHAHQRQRRFEPAIACYKKALSLKADLWEAMNGLATALQMLGRSDEAVAWYQRTLTIKPDDAETHCNLGNALKDGAMLSEALACYRRALDIRPDVVRAHDSLVYTMQFCPELDASAIYDEHRRWNERHAAPLAACIRSHPNDRSPGRRLKIGYVSPDFRIHCQAFFTTTLLARHDHRDFEICCYSDVREPDEITRQLQSYADVWRNTAGLSDEELAQAIRRDQIDILVDLTMHMGHNRLLMFARKPAPVQVCWLAYPGTTGLTAIDYRLTDPYLDPPGGDDACYSEESIRLPDSFWCYDPLTSEPAVNGLPALERGDITFGSFNNFCKVNPPVVQMWARVLKAVERSRLMLLAYQGSHRQKLLDHFEREGVSAERVTILDYRARREYLDLYHQIDLGLDTLPYNGHTTSLDAFWMGVPVVTMKGRTVVGRAGYSQLMNLGLPQFAAETPEQFVRIAAEWAADLPRLCGLRAGLRERMRTSPLMDAPRFALNIEAAYRAMWQRWCKATAANG